MRVLTDTHTIVWSLSKSHQLSKAAKQALQDANEVCVSVVNLWELLLKRGRPTGLLKDPLPWWEKHVEKKGYRTIPILPEHIKLLDHLEDDHADPFDRMLIAQCLAEGLTLVSKDNLLPPYGVSIIW